MPHESVIKILERIKPDYMQYLIGNIHINTLLSTQHNDPIKNFIEFVNNKQWKKFLECGTKLVISKSQKKKLKNVKDFTKFLVKKLDTMNSQISLMDTERELNYNKFDPHSILKDNKVNLNHVIHTFYITLEAYLDAYNVQDVQESLDNLNERLNCDETSISKENHIPEYCSYSVTENFIKKYRTIYQTLKELMLILQSMKNSGDLPENFKVFEEIGLLGM